MNFTKYRYGTVQQLVGVLPDCYCYSLSSILEMVKILKADYPFLRDGDIGIVQYGPPVNEHKLGVEAFVDSPLKDYNPYPSEWLRKK